MISISMFLVLLLCNVLIALIFFLMISNFVEKQVLKSLNENYDLVKFGLILNGICLSVWNKKVDNLEELKEDFYADIIDINSYDLIGKNTKLNNDSIFSAIKIVIWDDEEFLDEYYINALNVLDLIY